MYYINFSYIWEFLFASNLFKFKKNIGFWMDEHLLPAPLVILFSLEYVEIYTTSAKARARFYLLTIQSLQFKQLHACGTGVLYNSIGRTYYPNIRTATMMIF